ncbi:MAG: hypothetical protein LUE27_08975 [Clostridia bacterium]|nr:hypothetical protein [Clostridia bacterium]
MRFFHGYKTLEEAKKAAKTILEEARGRREKGPDKFLQGFASKDIPGIDPGEYVTQDIGFVKDPATGAFVAIANNPEIYFSGEPIPGLERYEGAQGDTYSLAYLSPREADPENASYLFRGTSDIQRAFFPFTMPIFFRPVEAISPTEAYTIEGMRKVEAFYGGRRPFFYSMQRSDFSGEEEADRILNKMIRTERAETDRALEEALAGAGTSTIPKRPEKDGADMGLFLPCDLSEALRIELPNLNAYFAALAALYGIDRAKGIVIYNNYLSARAFLRYALYELARTESYARLREVLFSFSSFYLPPQWESLYLGSILNHFSPDPGETPEDIKSEAGIRGESPRDAETAVLSRYVNGHSSSLLNDLETLSDHLGAPREKIYRAAGYSNKYF